MLQHEKESKKDLYHLTPNYNGRDYAKPSLDEAVEIQMQILSNWGHRHRVGLTEIQFLNGDKQVVSISPSDIRATGCDEEKGELASLLNGKTKTIKERFMWSCAFKEDPEEFVSLMVTIPKSRFNLSKPQECQISWMCIWNFNKSPKELDIGAKGIKIYMNSYLAFEGQLDRGCGNQVFEYGQFISLETVSEHLNNLQELESISELPVHGKSGITMAKSLESSPIRFPVDSRGWQSKPSSSRGSDTPTWFKELNKNKDVRNTWVNKDALDGHETTRNSSACSRISSGRRSGTIASTSSLTLSDDGSSSRCSSESQSRWADASPMLQALDFSQEQLDNLESSSPSVTLVSRESSAKYGRRGMQPKDSNVVTNNRTLEESLRSLHNFERSHRGRLTTELEDCISDGCSSWESMSVKGSRQSSLDWTEECDEFIIPELPEGQQLVFNIQTTWGDNHYVGLNGIELFSASGEPVRVRRIWADPSDINVLPEYSKDPRVVTNLINGIYRTKDDLNLWLAPFTEGEDHLIFVDFESPLKLAMIRIWNYNKSRIHSCRGAKDVKVLLDDRCVFKGEIAKACGEVNGGLETFGDTILFTLDEEILENISRHDENFAYSPDDEVEFERNETPVRPSTVSNERPFTSVAEKSKSVGEPVGQNAEVSLEGRCVQFHFLSNWGDSAFVGLNGLELLGEDGERLPFTSGMINASSSAQTSSEFGNLDDGIEKLCDGKNVTTDPDHAWRTAFRPTRPIGFAIHFPTVETFAGIRIWNYNQSIEESYLGVKQLAVKIDERLVAPAGGFLIRRAPGNCHFDFAQEISFSAPLPYSWFAADISDAVDECDGSSSSRMSAFQEYEPSVMPCGFVFQLQLLSTWGDMYYVGLNGLEVCNATGEKIPLSEGDIAAYPDSVNVLDEIDDDERTPDKLINGINDTRDGRNMWLAPILPNIVNKVYVIFDFPVTVSLIKLWNYGKTPCRGVKDFALLVDDLLVYHGTLGKADADFSKSVLHHTVLFTTNSMIHEKEKLAAIRNDKLEQENEDPAKQRDKVDQSLRPFTSIPSRKQQPSLMYKF